MALPLLISSVLNSTPNGPHSNIQSLWLRFSEPLAVICWTTIVLDDCQVESHMQRSWLFQLEITHWRKSSFNNSVEIFKRYQFFDWSYASATSWPVIVSLFFFCHRFGKYFTIIENGMSNLYGIYWFNWFVPFDINCSINLVQLERCNGVS